MSLLATIQGVDEEEKHRHASENESYQGIQAAQGMDLTKAIDSSTDGHKEHHADDANGRDMRRYAFTGVWWARFVRILEWWEDLQEPPRSGLLYRTVRSHSFENLSSAVIVANCAFTAYVADWNSQHIGQKNTSGILMLEQVFLGYYSVELLLRLIVHGIYFFANEEARWNWFDFGLVLLSLGEEAMSRMPMSNSMGASVSFMRIFRIVKMAKIFRTLRVMKVFKELGVILECFTNCFVSLFWCFVMMAFIFYVFALVLLQGVTTYLEEAGDSMTEAEMGELTKYFGSLHVSMLTLYMAVTGGDDWGNSYSVVKEAGTLYAMLYLFFTFFFAIAVMNILTGVFVEKAVAAGEPDEEAQVLEHRRHCAVVRERMMEICKHWDDDGDGSISVEEFQRHVSNEYLQAFLSVIGLNVRDARGLFEILSTLGSRRTGKVDVHRFVEGCMALKGNASTLDVHRQLLETRAVQEQVAAMESKMSDAFAALEARVLQQEVNVSRRHDLELPLDSTDESCATVAPVLRPLKTEVHSAHPSDGWRMPYIADLALGTSAARIKDGLDETCTSAKATPHEVQLLLDKLRDELVAETVPQIVSSICKLTEQQLLVTMPVQNFRSRCEDAKKVPGARTQPDMLSSRRVPGCPGDKVVRASVGGTSPADSHPWDGERTMDSRTYATPEEASPRWTALCCKRDGGNFVTSPITPTQPSCEPMSFPCIVNRAHVENDPTTLSV